MGLGQGGGATTTGAGQPMCRTPCCLSPRPAPRVQRYARDASVGDAAEFVGDMRQIMLGRDGGTTSPEEEPTSM